MSIESDADWRGLRTVGRIVRLTLDALEQHARPGVSTRELDDVAAHVFAAHHEHTVVITRGRPVLLTAA